MRLHTRILGRGPDLVLLHGWGMNDAVWSAILPALSKRHRLTLVELPGHGNSPYDPSLDSLQGWASACLDVAPARADWLGWSLGGQLAVKIGLAAPHRVGKLVLLNSNPRFVKGVQWPHAIDEPVLRQFASALKRNPEQALNRFLSLQVQGDEAPKETLRLLREDVARRPAPHPKALEQGLELLLTVDLSELLPQLRRPSLWLFGARDTLVPATVAGDIAPRITPGGTVRILEGCAHAPFLSHPAESLSVLMGYLGDSSD